MARKSGGESESMANDLDALRAQIQARLEGGLQTEAQPRSDTHEKIQEVINRLQTSDQSLDAKLIIGGFTLTPVTHGGLECACETCMYYKVHQKYCELPELELPVEEQWSCRLWRI